MKKTISLFMAMLMFSAQIISSAPANLRGGTSLTLRSTEDMSSKKCQTPQFIVSNNVYDENGKILIEQGTPVVCESNCKKARGVGKPGQIEINFISTTATDGKVISLTGNREIEGESKKGQVLGLGLGLGFFIFPPFFAFLAKKGGNAVLKANTIVHATVTGDYTVSPK